MYKKLTTPLFLLFAAAAGSFSSCNFDDDDTDNMLYRPTALVTVKPIASEGFLMQLNDSTRLVPANMAKSPFGDKEVRALVNYKVEPGQNDPHRVHINWIDSIRTKMTVPSLGDMDHKTYGNDPIEIVNDWVSVAEDGYLTLRIRTLWGNAHTPHYINLLTGTDAKNPYVLELRHDAKGDYAGSMGDALIAFNLREVLKGADTEKVKFTLRWKSFNGEKNTTFELKSKPMDERSLQLHAPQYNSNIR